MPKVLGIDDNRSLAGMAKAIVENTPDFKAYIAATGLADGNLTSPKSRGTG